MNKIVIVEDQKILLDGLELSLSKYFDVVGKKESATDILPFLTKNKVDLILSDICTKDSNCLDVVKDIKTQFPTIKFVAMTGMPELSFMEKAQKEGVDSFVYKNIGIEELVNILKNTLNGYSTYPNQKISGKCEILENLSKKELEILRLFCSGQDKDEIAKTLGYSESTIRQAFRSMLDKTGFDNMNKLAIFVVNNGFILPK